MPGRANTRRGVVATVAAMLLLALVLEALLRIAEAVLGLGAAPELPCARPLAAGEATSGAATGSSPRAIRVAVFGESSAAGFSAPLSFAAVVEQGLRRAFPETCVFVRNYAQEGARFHGDQAELAKAVLPSFDVLLIYAGNNEVLNAVFAQGNLDVFGLPNVPDARPATADGIARALAELHDQPPIATRLGGGSRLVALARRGVDGAIDVASRLRARVAPQAAPGEAFHGSAPPASAPAKAVPQAEIDHIPGDYGADLAAIGALAARLDKTLVVSTVFTYDTWPPWFSKRRDDLSDAERRAFDAALERGHDDLAGGRPEAAAAALDEALRLDPRHARANQLRGLAEIGAGRPAAAWPYLETARDEDGFPIRTLSGVNRRIRDAAGSAPGHVVVADPEQSIRTLVARGARFDDVMNDPQHPGLVGQVAIGRAMLCALSALPRYDRPELRASCAPLDVGALAASWPDARDPRGGGSAALDFARTRTRIGWLSRMRRIAAHRESFVDEIARAWQGFRVRQGLGDDDATALLAALAGETPDERVAGLRRFVAGHGASVPALLRDGLQVEDPSHQQDGFTVLTADDVGAILRADGVRIEPADGQDEGSSWRVVRE
jgi:hypothetical protein